MTYTAQGYSISGRRLEEMQKHELNIKTVRSRMRDGWTIWEAVTTPVKRSKQLVTKEQREIALKNGIPPSCLNNRVYKMGWNVEQAITVPPNPQGKKFKKTKWELR
jgi:hypothetical protein